jgi:phage tail sheath gpL-like
VTTGLTVVPRPHPLTGITINPTTIQSGQQATGTVTLGGPAGAGGVVVNLISSNDIVSVPLSVTVAQGATSASFTATAGKVTKNTTVGITAYRAGLQATASLTVQ